MKECDRSFDCWFVGGSVDAALHNESSDDSLVWS